MNQDRALAALTILALLTAAIMMTLVVRVNDIAGQLRTAQDAAATAAEENAEQIALSQRRLEAAEGAMALTQMLLDSTRSERDTAQARVATLEEQLNATRATAHAIAAQAAARAQQLAPQPMPRPAAAPAPPCTLGIVGTDVSVTGAAPCGFIIRTIESFGYTTAFRPPAGAILCSGNVPAWNGGSIVTVQDGGRAKTTGYAVCRSFNLAAS